uniref:Uncharacterized protein n=1 Tax=Anguilla anguilla TaxID=7936 RepID=A0A0E9VJF8_ANGAN
MRVKKMAIVQYASTLIVYHFQCSQ